MSKEILGRIEVLSPKKYKLVAVLGYRSDGTAIRRTRNVEAKNERQAYRLLDEFIEQFESIGSESLDLFNISFGEFYKEVWHKEAQHNVEPKTFHHYNLLIVNRFLEPFEHLPLVDIRPYMIKKIIVNAQRMGNISAGKISDKPLSRNTKVRMLYAVNNLFLMARDEYKIIKDNPCDHVKIPKEKGRKKNVEEPYSEEEVQQLIAAALTEESPNKALVLTALITGARGGEIAALEEKDIDFEKLEIRFHQRITEVDSKSDIRLLPGLKNDDDEKIVTIPSFLSVVLKELMHYNKQVRWEAHIKQLDHYFLFETEQDGRLPRGSYLYRRFKRFTKRHGLRHIRLHDLRHTSAALLLSDPNMTTKELQERLGHRSHNTTMDIYGHVLKKKEDAATTFFDDFLSSKTEVK